MKRSSAQEKYLNAVHQLCTCGKSGHWLAELSRPTNQCLGALCRRRDCSQYYARKMQSAMLRKLSRSSPLELFAAHNQDFPASGLCAAKSSSGELRLSLRSI